MQYLLCSILKEPAALRELIAAFPAVGSLADLPSFWLEPGVAFQ